MTVIDAQNDPCNFPKLFNPTKVTLVSIRRTVNTFNMTNNFDRNGRHSIQKSIIFTSVVSHSRMKVDRLKTNSTVIRIKVNGPS